MRAGRVLILCLGMLMLLAVNPAVRLPAEGRDDVGPRVRTMLLGRPARACALMGFERPVGSTQQAARQDPCSKPKVYVKVGFFEGLEERLNRDYPPKTNDEWLPYLSGRAVYWLREMGGEGVDVIPHEQKVFTEDRPDTKEEELQ